MMSSAKYYIWTIRKPPEHVTAASRVLTIEHLKGKIRSHVGPIKYGSVVFLISMALTNV